MKKLNLTLVAVLCLGMVTSLGAAPENPKSRRAELSTAELQKLLGIESWEVELPEDFGDSFRITFEHLIGGKRAFIISGGASVPESGRFPVARKEVDDTIEITVILEEGNLPLLVPKEHLIVRKSDFAWYSVGSYTPKKTAAGILLYTEKIFKVPFKNDGRSFSTTDPRAQHVATSTLKIDRPDRDQSE